VTIHVILSYLICRQQKTAEDSEKATRVAEKAAEDAVLKAKQQALEEEQRKKQEEEHASHGSTPTTTWRKLPICRLFLLLLTTV